MFPFKQAMTQFPSAAAQMPMPPVSPFFGSGTPGLGAFGGTGFGAPGLGAFGSGGASGLGTAGSTGFGAAGAPFIQSAAPVARGLSSFLPGAGSSFLSQAGQLAGATSGAAGSGLNLMGMFTNVQKAINTAQTVIPMVQKFGPIVKNAPALLSMLKSLKEINNTSDAATGEEEKEEEKKEEKEEENDELKIEPEEEQTEQEDKKDSSGSRAAEKKKVKKKPNKTAFELEEDELVSRPSKPKMYI